MRDLPQIFFGSKFREPDQSTLSPEAIKRLDAVRTSYNAVQTAEKNVEIAQAEITEALQQVAAAEATVKPYGEYGFHRLWRQHVQGH